MLMMMIIGPSGRPAGGEKKPSICRHSGAKGRGGLPPRTRTVAGPTAAHLITSRRPQGRQGSSASAVLSGEHAVHPSRRSQRATVDRDIPPSISLARRPSPTAESTGNCTPDHRKSGPGLGGPWWSYRSRWKLSVGLWWTVLISDVNRKPKIWYTKKIPIANRYLVFLS